MSTLSPRLKKLEDKLPPPAPAEDLTKLSDGELLERLRNLADRLRDEPIEPSSRPSDLSSPSDQSLIDKLNQLRTRMASVASPAARPSIAAADEPIAADDESVLRDLPQGDPIIKLPPPLAGVTYAKPIVLQPHKPAPVSDDQRPVGPPICEVPEHHWRKLYLPPR